VDTQQTAPPQPQARLTLEPSCDVQPAHGPAPPASQNPGMQSGVQPRAASRGAGHARVRGCIAPLGPEVPSKRRRLDGALQRGAEVVGRVGAVHQEACALHLADLRRAASRGASVKRDRARRSPAAQAQARHGRQPSQWCASLADTDTLQYLLRQHACISSDSVDNHCQQLEPPQLIASRPATTRAVLV